MADPEPNPVAPLGREEYIEQAHVFAALGDRLKENVPAQEALTSLREEVLATTKLPIAIDFMLSELRHAGMMSLAMAALPHYFTPLQAYVVEEAEKETGRFDLRIGLEVLRCEAQYKAGEHRGGGFGIEPTRQGLFLFQFESIARNRLSYDRGLAAIARDPAYDQQWREWVLSLRRKVGFADIADLIYVHSEHYAQRIQRTHKTQRAGSPLPPAEADSPAKVGDDAARCAEDEGESTQDEPAVLFSEREGRIALANRRKDPLYLFNSLHRQLGYPSPPRPEPATEKEELSLPQLARRLEQIEKRMTLIEEEQRGGIDLTKFYEKPNRPPSEP